MSARARGGSLVLVLASAFGCSGSPPGSVDVSEYQTLFDQWCGEADGLMSPESDDIPAAPWPNPARPGAQPKVDYFIEVTPNRVLVNGEEHERWLDTVEADSAKTWALAASAQTRVTDVSAVLRAIADKIGSRGHLYFANPGHVVSPPPEPSRADAELAALEATSEDRRGMELAGRLEKFSNGCAPFAAAMEKAGPLSGNERCAALASTVPAALSSCPSSDHSGIMAVMYLMFGAEKHARAQMQIELATDAGDGVTELHHFGEDEVWGDVVGRWFSDPATGPIMFHKLRAELEGATAVWGRWRNAPAKGQPIVELTLSDPDSYVLHWTKPGARKPFEAKGSWTVSDNPQEPGEIGLRFDLQEPYLAAGYRIAGDSMKVLCSLGDGTVELARVEPDAH